MEKRLNFTIADLDVSAPSYKHFRSIVHQINQGEFFKNLNGNFNAYEVPIVFPKYFSYDRVKYLELWKLDYHI